MDHLYDESDNQDNQDEPLESEAGPSAMPYWQQPRRRAPPSRRRGRDDRDRSQKRQRRRSPAPHASPSASTIDDRDAEHAEHAERRNPDIDPYFHGSSADEVEEGGDGDERAAPSVASSRAESAAGPSQRAPAPEPAPVMPRYCAPRGHRRQRLEEAAGDAAVDEACEAEIAPGRLVPVLQANELPVEGALYSATLRFDRIFGARCFRGEEYTVKVGGPEDPEVDGLAAYFAQRVRGLLEGAAAASSKAAEAVEEMERTALCSGVCRALRRAAMDDKAGDADDGPLPVLRRVVVRLAQRERPVTSLVAAHASSCKAHAGVDVDSGRLRDDTGKSDAPCTDEDTLAHSSIVLELGPAATEGAAETDGAPVRITVDARGARWERIAPSGRLRAPVASHNLHVPLEDAHALLTPATWALDETVVVRKRCGHPDLCHDGALDPLRLCLLTAALSSGSNVRRWVVALQLSAANLFVGVKGVACGGKDRIDLDHCDGRFFELVDRVRRDIANLAHDMDRLHRLFIRGINQHYFTRAEASALVTKSDMLANPRCRPTDDETVGMNEEQKRQLWMDNIFAEWANESHVLKTRLRRRVENLSPETGTCLHRSEKYRDAFARAVLSPNKGVVNWNQSNQVNFSCGHCWDGDLAKWRRVRPSDKASISTGYPKPEFDEEKRAVLLAFLREIHPNDAVLQYRLALKAQALVKGQGTPTLLSSVGVAGGGKSLESTLTQLAWGEEYSTTLDEKALQMVKHQSPEAPSPTFLSLRWKRFVCSDEVGSIEANVVKRLLGGMQCKARNLNEGLQTFYLDFPTLEILSNDSDSLRKRLTFDTDEGMQRRFKSVQFDVKFESCTNDKSARRAADRIARRLAAQRVSGGDASDLDDDDNDMGENNGDSDAVHPEGMTEVEYWSSFAGVMWPAKAEKLKSLGPTLMELMTSMHAEASKPGHDWAAVPQCVVKWTGEAIALAQSKNVLTEYVRIAFMRCTCTVDDVTVDPGVNDLFMSKTLCNEQTNEQQLVRDTKDQFVRTTQRCTHILTLKQFKYVLSQKSWDNKRTLLNVASGGSPNTTAGRDALLAKIKQLTCFVCDPDSDNNARNRKQMPIRLEMGAIHNEKINERYAIRGLVALVPTEPAKDLSAQFVDDDAFVAAAEQVEAQAQAQAQASGSGDGSGSGNVS